MNTQLKMTVLAGAILLATASHGQELVVKIGHVAPTSGAIAHLGKDNENGARMAVDELNAKGVTIGGKKVIHAAIFITTDIVFTKNGYDFTQPWVLMRKQDMLDTYAARYPTSTLQSIYFRKRSI
mgnify:CR=1 FL=1